MADFLPWFPFDFDAFMEGTPGWTSDERMAYLTLLREQWRTGWIPNAPNRLHLFVVGVSKPWMMRVWREKLREKFHAVGGHPDRLVNRRMADERDKAEAKIEQTSAAGRASAEERARRRITGAGVDGQASAAAAGAATAVAESNTKQATAVADTNTGYKYIGDKHTTARERVDAQGAQGAAPSDGAGAAAAAPPAPWWQVSDKQVLLAFMAGSRASGTPTDGADLLADDVRAELQKLPAPVDAEAWIRRHAEAFRQLVDAWAARRPRPITCHMTPRKMHDNFDLCVRIVAGSLLAADVATPMPPRGGGRPPAPNVTSATSQATAGGVWGGRRG